MTTLLYSHDACIGHDPGPHHPECPARLEAIAKALDAPEFEHLERREPPRATVAQIGRVHDPEYVTRVLEVIAERGRASLDGDTHVSPGSGEAALRAAGAVTAAVDAVMAGEAKNAFCAVRPPGHHAERAVAMGFCLFNNVAVGAEQARAVHGLNRAAVIDFDVHHGNGTQAMFWDDADLFYASTHQSPLYPGTGQPSETGIAGNIVNAALPPYAGSEKFRAAMVDTVLPALRDFAPDFLFISAGFDAHAEDPLAMLNFTEDDYRWATAELCAVATECCQSRIVSTLEGGYNLDALAKSAAAHVEALIAA